VILVDAGPAEELDGVTVLERATAIGLYEGNYVVAVQRGRRLWHPRAKRIVLATGAFERPEIFEHNDRPGVMLAGAAARYGVEEGVHPVSGGWSPRVHLWSQARGRLHWDDRIGAPVPVGELPGVECVGDPEGRRRDGRPL
jgi:NADPH-dependent 2,4-dienoyl-CoA reductase/sulfur reductase-like enzyme